MHIAANPHSLFSGKIRQYYLRGLEDHASVGAIRSLYHTGYVVWILSVVAYMWIPYQCYLSSDRKISRRGPLAWNHSTRSHNRDALLHVHSMLEEIVTTAREQSGS